MKALVTGAGGFLGRHIVRQLVDRGDAVRALGRGRYPALELLPIECVQADIRDAAALVEACRGVDVVYHTAAIAGLWGPWSEYYGINVAGTLNVIAACRAAGVKKLVFTGSPSVTFDGSDQYGVDESAPYASKWLCHYSHTKAISEQAVLAANSSELLTCSLRPHLIWGPGDQHLIPRVVARAQAGQLRRVGDGKNLIDITYIDNAAAAHLQAAAALVPGSPVAGRAYFLSQGEPVNCWEFLDSVLKLAGVAPVKKQLSYKAAWRIGTVLEGIHWLLRRKGEPRMTRFLAAQLATSHFYDITRAREDFGYEPTVSTEEGLRALAAEMQVNRS